jgi:hypothetical protein
MSAYKPTIKTAITAMLATEIFNARLDVIKGRASLPPDNTRMPRYLTKRAVFTYRTERSSLE